MAALSVSLLGEPQVRDADGPVVCSSKKALGLFCFLAYTGARHSRRDLARLFWDGRNVDAARASLRTTLLRLPPAMAQCLAVDRESIQLKAPIDLDTERFFVAARAGDVDTLREAVDLYRGVLLAGLEIDAPVEFDDWLARERARLRQASQSVFDRLIGLHRGRAQNDTARAAVEREAALATARRWCELEPAFEAAHRWLIRLYLDLGRTDAALAQYETCRRELAVAAGRTPDAATRALVESLQAGADSTGAAQAAGGRAGAHDAAVPAHGMPGTSFVGRVDELAELDRLLTEPTCRLLTLQALGGTGKSRLASVLADQLGARFAQGMVWVALEAVASAALVPQAIAQALGVDLPARALAADALCNALSSQERLLVLDNLEHLLVAPANCDADVVDLLLQILRDAPRVRLLVTSREVLGIQEEWIYELRGLPCPPGDGENYSAGAFGAVDLFAQRARQAYAGFSAAAEWPHIVRLCRLVEGLPLALELAAAWVRTIPCADLVGTIETELKAIATRHRNRPERHRSLEAVVRTSWTLLTREQQGALAPLCVFVGGFTQEAATAVADAPLRVMSALVDKSLVHRRADGRLGLHELVRQFLRRHLEHEGDGLRLAGRRHATYFAGLLERCRSRLDGAQGLEANTTLGAELPNLRAAAPHWQLQSGDTVVEAWLRVLSGRSLFREALPYAERMLSGDAALTAVTRAMALMYQGVAHVFLGDSARGDADLRAAIELARAHDLREAWAAALVQAALVGFVRDDTGLVEQRLADVEPLLDMVADVGVRVRAHYYRGMLLDTQGRTTEAAEHLAQTVALARRLDASGQLIATVQSSLGQALLRVGRMDEAEAVLKEVIEFFSRAGQNAYLARSLNALAMAVLWRSQGAEAAAAAKDAARALTLFEQLGYATGVSGAADTLGQTLAALGRVDEARALFVRSAVNASPLVENDAKVHLAMLCVDGGQLDEAARLAVDRIDAAMKHELGAIRRSAAVLAAMVVLGKDSSSPAARRWLAAVLSERDLEWDHRLRAQRLLASAVSAHGPADAAPSMASIGPAELAAMRDALVRMAG